MRIVTQKEEKIMNMFSLYHETLGYEDSDDDGLSSYIFFSMRAPKEIPRCDSQIPATKFLQYLYFFLSKLKLSCQDAYRFCWGCSTYLYTRHRYIILLMSQFGCRHGYNLKFTLMLNSSSNIFMTTQRRCGIKIMGF